MSNSALSLRQLVAVFQWSGADNVSLWTQSPSLTSPLCPHEGSLFLTDPLRAGDWNKVLYCSMYDKLIRHPNCVLVLIASRWIYWLLAFRPVIMYLSEKRDCCETRDLDQAGWFMEHWLCSCVWWCYTMETLCHYPPVCCLYYQQWTINHG